jgi:hypothetical protein
MTKAYRSADLTGQRFTRLMVLGRSRKKRKGANPYWRCRCDCGKVIHTAQHRLNIGRAKSCGCLKREMTIERSTTHGHGGRTTRSAEHKIWATMIQRCTNPNNAAYYRYGKVGIKVHEPWLQFENFLRDVGKRPAPHLSIDRFPNPAGNYEPTNVRWATAEQQANNRRKRGSLKS